MGFDIFGKKRIRELQEQVHELKAVNRQLCDISNKQCDDLNKLRKIIDGERVCEGYCQSCTHLLEVKASGIHWNRKDPIEYYEFNCELDCKCKDYERKVKTNG